MRHLSYDQLQYNLSLFQHPEFTPYKVKFIFITLDTIFNHLVEDYANGYISTAMYVRSITKLRDCLIINKILDNPFIDSKAILKAYNKLPQFMETN